MAVISYILIFSGLLTFILAAILYLRNPKDSLNRSFGLFVFMAGVWSLVIGAFQAADTLVVAWFWAKLIYVAGSIAPALFLNFAYVFSRKKTPSSGFRFFLIILPLIFTLLLYSTNWWIKEIRIIPTGKVVELGFLYLVWIAYFGVAMGLSIYLLLHKYSQSVTLERAQSRYILIGVFLASIGSLPFNVIAPAFGNYRFIFTGPLFLFVMNLLISYAIIKHRFLDVHLVVARSVAYLLLILTLGGLFVGGVFFATNLITQHPPHYPNMIFYALTALLLCFLFQPLLRILEKTTNKIFYKEKYDETALLHELILIMASKLRLKSMVRALLKKLLLKMRISRGAFILVDEKAILHLNHQGYRQKPKFSQAEIMTFSQLPEIAVFDELDEGPLKEMMRKLEISMIVPLQGKTEKEDCLMLGEKLSGDPYTNQDVGVLEIFAPQAAIALENALTVEKLLKLDEAKSEFITVVSHQLRTPLSAARWNFEILFEDAFGKVPDKAKLVLKRIYASLLDLNRGLNNLMLALEIEEGRSIMRYKKVDFPNLLKEALLLLERERVAKEITVKKSFLSSQKLKLDRQKVKKVLEILLDNALRYSPPKSTVKVTTRIKTKEKQFLVSVEDQGIGVESEIRDSIFQRFFRGEKAKLLSPGGFGLGLANARALVELHGGDLWLGKKRPPGSIFYFTLPF